MRLRRRPTESNSAQERDEKGTTGEENEDVLRQKRYLTDEPKTKKNQRKERDEGSSAEGSELGTRRRCLAEKSKGLSPADSAYQRSRVATNGYVTLGMEMSRRHQLFNILYI
ncbi:hypothetical protein BO85DRAFT_204110 [Aspergillus piperis CBS 112811]|uniref:Uncharacterized protein n=1 Tax=Aspergillus piperis CBS 112811 TaxID=1448313 RepID=A0A8G1QRQ8_9EURO|nr:hypothetical protein BO85DRAFT_204110 [Aspergillus piperis CBS 112811]RAH52389.1 hypothetical protein BO85DRAFT_204110 [Aspergillus piperis CBS 112811]